MSPEQAPLSIEPKSTPFISTESFEATLRTLEEYGFQVTYPYVKKIIEQMKWRDAMINLLKMQLKEQSSS